MEIDIKMDEQFKKQRAIGATGGVLLTTALMFGLALGLVYAYVLIFSDPFIDAPIAGTFILIGVAAGGAIGIRLAGLRWRGTVFAALLSGVGLIIFSRFEFSPLHPFLWLRVDSRVVLDLRAAAVALVVSGAGVFLLPLFDPLVRRVGPAPALWKVALVAVSLALLALLADYLVSGGFQFGLLGLIFGSIAALLLVGVGLILALANLQLAGAWVGVSVSFCRPLF